MDIVLMVISLNVIEMYHTRSSATAESTARPILVPIESSYATSY